MKLRVKRRLKCRFYEVRNAMNVDCLPRKMTGSEWSQPKREALLAANRRAAGAHIQRPSELDRQGLQHSVIASTGVCLALIQSLLLTAVILSFSN